MKKISLFGAMMLFMVGCSNQQFMDEKVGENCVTNPSNEIQALMEKAKWGDGQAYLELANCYRDGKGVQRDFMGMICMVAQAQEYGAIRRMENYLEELPEGSEFRLIIDAVEMSERYHLEEARSMSEQLIAMGSPEGYTAQGFIAMEKRDTLKGKQLLEMAAFKGSTFAELLICLPEIQGSKNPSIEKLKILAERAPMACRLLAKIYTGYDDENLKNERLAAQYYMKADKHAFLDKKGAKWLLRYHKEGGKLQLSGLDIQRLQILAGERNEPTLKEEEIVVDTVVIVDR